MKTLTNINDQEAQRLVDTYADTILRLSYTYLKCTQDAEDICQTVFLKLLTGDCHFDSPAQERAWILRTAANACKDELRTARRRKNTPLEAAAQRAAPEAPSGEVLAAVMALPENYRIAIYLHYYEGYAVQEIAQLLGQRPAAVSAHLSRGRVKLRKMLGGNDDESGF
jgi:RNA polymerase sigma-70 factor (ECF subfamily)